MIQNRNNKTLLLQTQIRKQSRVTRDRRTVISSGSKSTSPEQPPLFSDPSQRTQIHLQILSPTHHEKPISNDKSTATQEPFLLEIHTRRSLIMPQMPSSPHHHLQSNNRFATLPCSWKSVFFHARMLCVYFRVLILVSLPSLYLFVSRPHRFFILVLIFIVAFSITLFISLNLTLPRLPSIRLLLARSLPNHLTSTRLPVKASKPVIWSIGSKPKVEKKPNSGSWVQVYSNGDVYEGEFHKGKCSGSGVFYYNMSGRYEGDWVDEKYDGYGVETWAKGSRYRGQYRQGLRHGIGVYRFYTGDVFAGEWSNGQCHGCGVHTCEDGSRYVGQFKWGVKHGLGHYHFRNRDTYAGEYFADKMHGFGVYRFANGHLYEGSWHEGRRQGLGIYTFRNGETQSGHWQNGVLDVPSSNNSNPESPYVVNHLKLLNAVQEARQAAEKAYNVSTLDERVNKAVAAANKAANAARVAAVKAVQKRMHSPPLIY